MNINKMEFSPKDIDQGELTKFLNTLMNLDCEHVYNEIHIWSDSYTTIVEWAQVPYGSVQFQFVDDEHYMEKYDD